MSGFFGVASKNDCVMPLFFGVDYHSHLGTSNGGMAVYGKDGFQRKIHNILNSPFRTKFETDVEHMEGNVGIGCISDSEPQPLLITSKHGSYAICTVARINNINELKQELFENKNIQFQEMNKGNINQNELVAALINQKDSIIEGITYAQDKIDGSLSILLLFKDCIYASRDKYGRTPIIVGHSEDGYCVSFESSAFVNLGFKYVKDLGPGEIIQITDSVLNVLKAPNEEMKMCSFLWTYYGYPTSTYEGVNVETMRYRCGEIMKEYDEGLELDSVAGVPDSGIAHAIGYANASNIPYSRPFVKYTPTWPRSFVSQFQKQRNLIAHMKLIPVDELIRDKKLLLIDDSIVRGTQLRETVDFLYTAGVNEVHVRLACPPILFGCKYLNFSRAISDLELVARRVIVELENTDNVSQEVLEMYANPDHIKHQKMVEKICEQMNFTSLRYYRLDDLIKAIGMDKSKLCTYCFNGKC